MTAADGPLRKLQNGRRQQEAEPASGCIRTADARSRVRRAQPSARGADRPHEPRIRRCAARAAHRPRPRRRHRHRQERPRRPEDRGDIRLDGAPGVLRAPDRSLARRPRHDHARRRAAGAVVVRRDGRAEAAHHLFAALQRAADRHHLARQLRARPAFGHRAGAAAHQGGLPARPRADHLDDHAAGARRLPRHRAARSQGLHAAGVQGVPSRRLARGQPEVRLRRHAQGRPHAASRATTCR